MSTSRAALSVACARNATRAEEAIQLAVALTGLVDGHDPRVIDRGGQPRLHQEPRTKARVPGYVRRQQLQRHLAPESQVLGAIHHAPMPPRPRSASIR